jgi:hypothetical protein
MGVIGSCSVHDSGAEMVVGREHAVVSGEMTARWWDQGRQAAEEIDWCEREFGATVAQGTLRERATRPVESRESYALPVRDVLASKGEGMAMGFERKRTGASGGAAGAGSAVAGQVPGKRTLVDQVYGLQTKSVGSNDASTGEVRQAATAGIRGGGGSLPYLDRIQTAFGAARDLSGVNAHIGGEATDACDAIGAAAFATGNHVAFREHPDLHTAAHEAAHVVQQAAGVQLKGGVGEAGDPHERHADAVADRVVRGESAVDLLSQYSAVGATPSAPTIQRKVKPEDVSSEMIGQTFELAHGLSSGSTILKVKVVAWDNAKTTVTVEAIPSGAAPVRLDIPKKLLRTSHAAVAGMNAYSADAEAQAVAVDRADDKLADWNAKEAEYKKSGGTKLWAAEKARLEDVAKKKTAVLNRKLIQETMFNRFDAVIKKEVDAANAVAGFKGADALDPNLMKSMLFQESQLGTAGEHLEVPPSTEEKSRFNLGQVIDSSGMALLTMLEREQPALITKFHLTAIRTDLAAAQKRRAELQKKASRSAAEDAELHDLDGKSEQYWEAFVWGYRAAGQTKGFQEAIRDFYASVPAGSPHKDLDYAFWIHMAVLWLFEKHKKGMSWADTIRAYNGSGERAEHYRDAVTKRAGDAAAAAKAGGELTPSGI